MELAIDIETFGSTDLLKSGVYKYVEAEDFDILLFGYSYNGVVAVIDLAQGEKIPSEILYALKASDVLKTAYNANFERVCLNKKFFEIPIEQWACTMAKASMLGLPLALDRCAKALKISQQKDRAGAALIRYFTKPCKPTKANGERTRNLPAHDPEKWKQFIAYCAQDVTVEQAIRDTVKYTITDTETNVWRLDQAINDRGIAVDKQLIQNAIKIDTVTAERWLSRAVKISNLQNPNSVAQLKQWLFEETGERIASLSKDKLVDLISDSTDNRVTELLKIRQEISKSSIKKYKRMVEAVCADGRIRGLHQYYGANRTGRWAGRIVQPQNLTKNEMADIDTARQLVRDGDIELIEMFYSSTADTLSQLIRTSFVAQNGKRLTVADFSAIEARVISWLAGEKWRLDVFKGDGKIYEASGAAMFKVPIEDITKGSKLRQKAKIAELALGYQGGVDALIRMGALKMGLTEDELPELVALWRSANKQIVRLWKTIGEIAVNCVENGESISFRGLKFYMAGSVFFIKLPSGRCLSYLRPIVKKNRYGSFAVSYEGMDQVTKQWHRTDTYGGKLVENITQAIARDCLAQKMLDLKNYNIVLHVHDEIVIEANENILNKITKIMSAEIFWAKGLPLAVDAFESYYYIK